MGDRSHLFIYGTLKRGQVNHHLLAGQRFLGPAETAPVFRLLDLGWYPGLAESTEEEGNAVEGEVWEVTSACLGQLDLYEGAEYVRKSIALRQDFPFEIQAYLLKTPDWSRPDAGVSWGPDEVVESKE